MLELENQLCFKAYAVSRYIINMYRPILKEMNLTYPQYLVLLAMWKYKKMNISMLGNLLSLDTGTLTPLLKRMETKGLIEKVRSKDDERMIFINITKKGGDLKEKVKNLSIEIKRNLDITDEEYTSFINLTNLILAKSSMKREIMECEENI